MSVKNAEKDSQQRKKSMSMNSQEKPRVVLPQNANLTEQSLQLISSEMEVVGQPPDPRDLFETPADIYFAPLGYTFTQATADLMPGLRIVVSPTTSRQHIAYDVDVTVICLEGNPILQEITSVSELTIAMAIMLSRNVKGAMESVREKYEWNRFPFGGEKMLSEMTLGIVGMGRIGTHVANFGYMFSEVWTINDEPREADIVTLHLPLNNETKGMVDMEFISQMKRGSYLINTSRGEIVQDDIIVDALKSGQLAGYACDCLAGEFSADFNPKHSPLWRAMVGWPDLNIIITPHIGGSTKDAWQLTQETVIKEALECWHTSL